MIITVPEWARIGIPIYVRDKNMVRGDDPDQWYREVIVGYGYDGIFHKANNSPVYYTKFSEYNINIKDKR